MKVYHFPTKRRMTAREIRDAQPMAKIQNTEWLPWVVAVGLALPLTILVRWAMKK